MLQGGAFQAVCNLKEMRPPVFTKPVSLEVTFLVADKAEMALWIRGVERIGPRTISMHSEDLLEFYRMFVTKLRLRMPPTVVVGRKQAFLVGEGQRVV
jgi:D-amino peptidase